MGKFKEAASEMMTKWWSGEDVDGDGCGGIGDDTDDLNWTIAGVLADGELKTRVEVVDDVVGVRGKSAKDWSS